jgi:hypothetical protein
MRLPPERSGLGQRLPVDALGRGGAGAALLPLLGPRFQPPPATAASLQPPHRQRGWCSVGSGWGLRTACVCVCVCVCVVCVSMEEGGGEHVCFRQ